MASKIAKYNYYCHQNAFSLLLGNSRRTPTFVKQWVIPSQANDVRTFASLNTGYKMQLEKDQGMYNIGISKRLRLVRPPKPQTWQHSVDPARILIILLPWLNSKEKHVNKYIQLYLDLGLDVLCLKSQTQDFLWPPNSFAAAKELTEVLNQCKHYDHYLFHTMSIGSYNFTTFRVLAKEDEKVSEQNQKICGIIYDSIVIGAGKGGAMQKSGEGSSDDNEDDSNAIDKFVRGIAASVSQSKIVHSIFSAVAKMYFSLTKKTTLDYYEKAYSVVRDEPAQVPTLLFSSENDLMSDKEVVKHLADIWKKDHNIPLTLQIWEKSGHAQHLSFHRKEYIDLQRKFLHDIFSQLELNTRETKTPMTAKL